eukprot:753509-Hanusia_phi.AAC.3
MRLHQGCHGMAGAVMRQIQVRLVTIAYVVVEVWRPSSSEAGCAIGPHVAVGRREREAGIVGWSIGGGGRQAGL